MKARAMLAWGLAISAATPLAVAAEAKGEIKGLVEFRKDDILVVDGQRVRVAPKTRFKGVRTGEPAPLGYEMKAKGTWRPDRSLLAHSIELKPNKRDASEAKLLATCNEIEQLYASQRRALRIDSEGPIKAPAKGRRVISEREDEFRRARRVLDRLLPPYIEPAGVHLYVVNNPEWNAFAMANFAIYVHTGLLQDLDDDELAIVLGHELAHATLEHTRRTIRKGRWGRLAGGIAAIGGAVVGGFEGDALSGLGGLGASALSNGFSRGFEDQADRVGLRYAFEGGFDVQRAPALWRRFGEKYRDQSGVKNFLFGSHSRSADRAKNLDAEVAKNYAEVIGDRPSRPAPAK